jgi:diguanylate cyclase (GGDEF)-like protein/PAS domain S-box-containing protein
MLTLKSAGLIAAYLIAAKIGLEFGTVNNSATIFWAPGGIALATLLLGGIKYLPAVFIAALLAAEMVHAPLVFALGSSVGNTLETLIGYTLIRRFSSIDLTLSRIQDLFTLILLGGLIPAMASAMLGPITLLASGMINTDMLSAIMWRWWRADVLGIVFFTPLILVCTRKKCAFLENAPIWEITLLWISAFLTGQSIFFGWIFPGMNATQPPVLAWAFPLLIWAGLRTGRRNTAMIQLLFVTQALLSAYFKTGYFADEFVQYGLANFWIFAMLLAVIGMSLAILSSAQRRAAQQIALNAQVAAVSNDGVIIVDADTRILDVNPAFTRLTGYHRDEVIGKNPALLSSGKQNREFYDQMWKTISECGHWRGELWNRHKDGSAYLSSLYIHTLTDAQNRVVNRIGIFSDITQTRAVQENVKHQAQHDYLTNLPNRLLFYDRFSQQIALANRHKTQFALIFLDLNKFKPVNDTLGHQVGDLLLIEVAKKLTASVREIDTVSRFGGDEFAILVSDIAGKPDISALIDKIQQLLSEPFSIEAHPICISASIGYALYPDDGNDIETMLNKADVEMYRSKHKK